MDALQLVILDKTFSSWSMRPWLALKASGLPFTEISVQLDTPKTAKQIARYSPSGRLPVLIDGDLHIWDSIAICEYIHELVPERHLWPRDTTERAHARSIVAEMHSGFAALRTHLPMDLQLRSQSHHFTEQTVVEIKRVLQIWSNCLRASKGPFLFGDFGIADAFYAPVVTRFRTYQVQIRNPYALRYIDAMMKQPFVREWVQGARQEKLLSPAFR